MNRLVLSFVFVCGVASFGHADWPGFRGDGAGRVADANLPLNWSPDQNIAWKHSLRGYGQSSPVVFEDKAFITSVEGPNKETLVMTAVDLSNGEQLWCETLTATGTRVSDYSVARAAPTPVVDGEHVFAFYEEGDLAAWTHDGKLAWKRSLTEEYGGFHNHHGLGSSLAQTDDALVLLIEHPKAAFLLAVNKANGETAWKTDRPVGMSWSTPLVVERAVGTEIIVSAGGRVEGYSAEDGSRRWELNGFTGNSIPSPTIQGNFLYIGAAFGRNRGDADAVAASNCCIDLSTTPPQIVWRAKKAISHYASPLATSEYVYVVNKVGGMFCLDAETGRELDRTRLRTELWASPVAVGNRIYCFGKDGRTVVLADEAPLRIIAENRLWPELDPPKDISESLEKRDRGAEIDALLKKSDSNGDGVLQSTEFPARLARMLRPADKDGDGDLSMKEWTDLVDETRERTKESQASVEGTVVYGVAVAKNGFVIRTGSHLFLVKTDF